MHELKAVLIKCFLVVECFLMLTYRSNAQVPSLHTVQFSIDTKTSSPKIEKLIYGQFIELLFNYFEGGLWAEMLGDRKFFYPVSSSKIQSPVNTRNYLGRWEPVGNEKAVVCDSQQVFAGAHTPKIILSNTRENGIRQRGLSLQKDSSYTGRIVIAAEGAATVNVFMEGPDGVLTLIKNKKSLSKNFTTLSFVFKSPVTTSNASFNVTGIGAGFLWIGAASLMPANNIDGFRADILSLYREMNLGNFRWGGNASSGYDWRNGVGDRDKRPPIYDYAWNAMESNDVGTHEYLQLCRLLNAEPHIGVNAGFGDAHSAAAWVEYVNGDTATPMGKCRAANGHATPFHVKWWGIGNEMYGKWQLGNMSASHYAIKHNMFAAAMKKVDPGIILVASGASPNEMGCTSIYSSDYAHDTLPFKIAGKYDWSGNLIANCSGNFNYLAEHCYPLGDSAFDQQLQRFVSAKNDSIIDKVRRLPNRIKGSVEAFRQYQILYPVVTNNNLTLALDEWRMKDGGYGMKDALATAEGYHEIFRHTDIIKMSTFTATDAPACLLYDATHAALQPAGLLIKMLSRYFGSIPVRVYGGEKQHDVSGTVGVDKPTETSGSDTYPLDVSAALLSDSNTLTVSLINPTGVSQNAFVSFTNGDKYQLSKKRWITGPGINSYNEPGQPATVSIREASIYERFKGSVELPPYSITLLELLPAIK